ncbi:MAG: hypothetical protein HYZ53_08640 [Planctomycetes bacterium]|nr:hypothetical protein [Planctomycetota bacterium]
MLPRRPSVLACAALALAATAAFVPALDGPFFWDDAYVVFERERTRQAPDLLNLLFCHRDANEGYRPLVEYTLAVNWALGPDDPRVFHAFNLLLHALNSTLLFLLLRRFGLGPRASFLAALLFAVHPVHAEVACAISQRAGALAAFWYLLGWLAFLRRGAAGLGLALVAYACGILSWEGSATLPAALFLSEAVLHPPPGRREWLRLAGRCALFVLPLAVCIALRRHSFEGVVFPERLDYFEGVPWLVRALTMARFFLEHYLPGLVAGVGLVSDYSAPAIPNSTPGDAWAWAALAALAAVVGHALHALFRKRSVAACGVAICLLGFLPVSNLLVRFYGLGAQRYTYLPMLGVALAAAAGLERLFRVERAGLARARAALVGATLLTLFVLAAVSAARWADPEAEYRWMLSDAPMNHSIRHNLGLVLCGQERWAEAYHEFEEELEAVPGHAMPLVMMARIHLLFGRKDEARRALEAFGHEEIPGSVAAAGAGDGAGDAASPVTYRLKLPPGYLGASVPALGRTWSELGLAYEREGRMEEAESAYRHGVQCDPYAVEPAQNLGTLLRNGGRIEPAAAAFREAIARAPRLPESRLSLGLLLMGQGAAEEGRQQLEAFLALARGRPDLAAVAEKVDRKLHPADGAGTGTALGAAAGTAPPPTSAPAGPPPSQLAQPLAPGHPSDGSGAPGHGPALGLKLCAILAPLAFLAVLLALRSLPTTAPATLPA